MMEIQNILEAIWKSSVKSRGNLKTCCAAETNSLFILKYCGSLRGFKTPKHLLSDLKKQKLSTKESQENANRGNLVPPHVLLPPPKAVLKQDYNKCKRE